MTDIDAKLLQWATPTQRKWIESWIDLGSSSEAAEAHGVNPANVRQALARVKRKAARAGYPRPAKGDDRVPPGQHERGRSVLRRANGEVVLWWDKSAKDRDDKMAIVLEAIEDVLDKQSGKSIPVDVPKDALADLLAVYSMGDPHLGMIASRLQSGDDFDADIMRRELLGAMALLVERAPPAKEALIISVGDLFHFDNHQKTTTRGTPQESALTVEEMASMGVDLLVTAIELAKRKHETVSVILAKGNHDKLLSFMLSKVLEAYYRNDPRVTIVVNPGEFTYHAFGVNLFGVAHGENPRKIEELEPIMVRDCDRDGLWATGQHRVWYTGHVHHKRVHDMRNCTILTLRTLAPGSTWSHGAGYRSIQEMKCDLYHRRYGRRGDVVAGIEEIRDYINRSIPRK